MNLSILMDIRMVFYLSDKINILLKGKHFYTISLFAVICIVVFIQVWSREENSCTWRNIEFWTCTCSFELDRSRTKQFQFNCNPTKVFFNPMTISQIFNIGKLKLIVSQLFLKLTQFSWFIVAHIRNWDVDYSFLKSLGEFWKNPPILLATWPVSIS